MTRGQLPKAYLRLDPNVDQQHPDNLADFIRLLCAGARQSHRGRFSSRAILESLFGKAAVRRFYDRGDVAQLADGRVEIPGWDLWQEGDFTVGERMQRLRSKTSTTHQDPSQYRNNAVTEPSPDSISPSEASRRLGVKASDVPTSPPPKQSKPSAKPVTAGKGGTVDKDGQPQPSWEDTRGDAWAPLRATKALAAWHRRFALPPTEAQRALLVSVAESDPDDIAEWIADAPPGSTYGVVEYARSGASEAETARQAAKASAASEKQRQRNQQVKDNAERDAAKVSAGFAAFRPQLAAAPITT